MNFTPNWVRVLLAVGLGGTSCLAAPKNIVISLDGATPRLVEKYLQNGALDSKEGLGLLKAKGFHATINETVSPSLTAVGHIAIATGSKAAKNDVVANTYHLVASPFTFTVSGFGAPIGGYLIDGPAETPSPTAEPIWLRLGLAGKKVVTATWPGGDGVDVRVPGATNNAIVQPAAERTVDYTVPFGAATAPFQKGFTLSATNFGAAPQSTIDQLVAAGHPSFSPIVQADLESFTSGGASYNIKVAALDTTNDGIVNYDTVVFFDATQGIQPGPFVAPATGPAYIKPKVKISALFYLEGHANKGGVRYFASQLAPDLSTVRLARTSVSFIPRNPAVLGDVDDINNNVGFWQPQPDFRMIEKLDAVPSTFANFPDLQLEAIYEELVNEWIDYQTRVALRALSRKPDADLVMIYLEQPDGSSHQFLLTDPRQPTDPTNPSSSGNGQDPAKIARYASYVQKAYVVANKAVQRIIEAVGVSRNGEPNSNVFVVSDHGFDTFHTAVNVSTLLAQNGIPSTKVRAVTSGPAANIYISLQGREPNGIVSRQEYLQLQQQVAQLLSGLKDTNLNYTLGATSIPVFDTVYVRPTPTDLSDPSFGRATTEFIGQDSGDVYALLTPGYNFDGAQTPIVNRLGDPTNSNPVLSLPNFYGAHGYDPTFPNMSAIFLRQDRT